ncbi:MAG TPA: GH3 auxin-responsive promoter family protein [Bacteroidales bacterium]|nr:GH3 auxin-responsive promoter family protein [Bacteroidales bacterium]HOX78339.1 GH3 auxin-responsive promoter family protein [Bacteroidales bacterium]HPI87274.1 GH3 auxin-responsive promoter family protein [Bacteroidales bacterium]HPM93419.1 GH3 auxin-responsive promoter family protein [Bacteroidales bacterium]
MALINSVLYWLIKKRIHQIDLFIKYPHDVQAEWFRRLITTAKDTEWGKEYGYSSISNVGQYRERVPVSTYEDLKGRIDLMRQGKQNILWPTDIRWFAKSSGTTDDRSKFIPVSQESLEECHYKGGKDMLSLYCNNFPNTALFSGRGLAIGGSHKISEINAESYYDGDLSAIIIQNLPFWAEFIRVPRKSTALMDNWEEKIEMMADETIPHNLTSLSGVPSWMLLLLRRVLEKTGKSDIMEVWPNLEVYFHGGVNFTPYREQFRQIIRAGEMNYMETYNASEGFFGLQDCSDSSELLLMLDYGIFYEFIPVSELDNDHPRACNLDEVDTETHYAMVISTNAGLWRYLIGDTVKFTSINPFRIRITGRTKNFINAVGEEVIIDNAEKALAVACRKCHAVVNEYTAAPLFLEKEKKVAHEWLIEFDTPPPDLEYFTETLDNALKSLNSDYEAKRFHDLILLPPVIRIMAPGTFYNWLKNKGKLGGQNKVPRLSNHRTIIEEILTV